MIYEEKAPFGWGGKILCFIFPVLVITMLALFYSIGVPLPALVIQTIISLTVILAIWFFWNTSFIITNNSVKTIQGPVKYEVLFKDIESVEVCKVPWWFGLGLRLNVIGGRVIGFITRKNYAVEIKKKTGFFNTVWLTTENPEEFAEKIRKAAKLNKQKRI
ncbi:MAG: hypothetical protein ABH803_01075 [Candidatus Micrarchaeota archaeon]